MSDPAEDRISEVDMPDCLLNIEAVEDILAQYVDAQPWGHDKYMGFKWIWGADEKPVGVRIDLEQD